MKGLEAKTLGLRKMLRHEYKRIVAFMLTVAMVVTNFGTNLTVAFAAGEEESSLFLLNSSELEDAISAALESGDVFDFSSLELKAKQKSLKTSYEKLIGSKAGKVYQLDVDIDSSYATEHTDLQVFYNAGTDDVVFLFINESDMAVTFRANVSGYETARVTVNPNTTNIEDAEGVENAEDYSGTTMVDDEKKPQAEVVKPEGETSESESTSDETEAAETEADVTESENASENGEAEETTGAEKAAETETSEAAETEAETEPETEAEAPAADEAEKEIELTPEEGSASASISAKKVFRVSTSAEAAGEAPAADAEEETEAEEPEKETEAPVETTAEETVADDSTEETIADETQADETTAADETDGELTDETEAPTEDVTAPDETNGEEPADNDGSENIGFDNDEQFLEDDSIELAGELNGKAYNTVTIWGSANARAYVVKAEDLTGEAAVEGQYSVDYSVDPVGAATIKGAHTVNEGETLYFAVDPQVGYEITEVTANGEDVEEVDAAGVASASNLTKYEHVYAVAEVTEDLEIVATLEEIDGVAHPEFNASYVSSDGVTISLHAEEGILPEGTELEVTEVTAELGDTIKEKMESESEGAAVNTVLAYDINLLYDGNKLDNSWSENGYVDVTFTGAPIQEMSESADTVEIVAVDDTSATKLSAENAAEVEASELKLETVGEQNVEGTAVDEVGFKAEHFTIYAVTGSYYWDADVKLKNMTIYVGDSLIIYTSEAYGDGQWSSSNPDIADVKSTDSYKWRPTATLTAKTAGKTEITCSYYNDYGKLKSDSATITVKDQIVSATKLELPETATVVRNSNITITPTVLEPQNAIITWTTSDSSIATVNANGQVTGVKPGTVTIAAQSGTLTASTTVTVTGIYTYDKTEFYYLKTPTSDKDSNSKDQWGKQLGGSNAFGKIDLTGATFTGKNSYDNVANRVVAWPDGSTGTSYNVVRGSEAWNEIVSYWKGQLSQQLGVDIESADVESIILKPYKISDNERYHVDCTIDINCKKVVTAKYHLLDAGATQFDQVEAKTFKVNTGETQPQKNYPATKTVNNKIYTFVGWYDNEACTGTPVKFPYKVGSTNLDFYAKYVRSDLKYTVNYYEEGTTTKVAFSKENQPAGTPGTIIKENAISVPGYTLVSNAQQQIVVKEDGKNEINFYYRKNSYKVTYTYSGTVPSGASELPTEKSYKYGEQVTVAEAASAPGYTFSGWSRSENFTMPAEDVVISGSFTANSDTGYKVEHYKETLDGSYELADTDNNLKATTDTTVTATQKNYEGFTYDSNVKGTIASGTVTGDGNLVLKLYYVRNAYKVTYEYTGTVPVGTSSLPAVETYKYGAEVTVAEAANAPGYTFSGWSRSENFTMPAEDVVISGSFTANSDTGYKVEHYKETLDGSYELADTDNNLKATTDTTVTATQKNYEGFTYDSNVEGTIASGTVTGDGNLVLKLYYVRNTYKVTYEYTGTVPVGASSLPAVETYKYGAEVTVAEAASALGYTFSGWSRSENFTMPAENVVITGSFTANSDTGYKVEHYKETLDGSYELADTDNNLKATTDTTVTATQKNYEGFTYDSNVEGTIASGTVTGDGSLVLKLYYVRNAYKVTYEYTGTVPVGTSSLPAVETYKYGERVRVAEAASAPGYTFSGWNKPVTFTMPAENVVISGSFTANGDTPYKVIHYLQNLDGTTYTERVVENLEGETNTKATANPRTTFKGYTFDANVEGTQRSGIIAGDGSLVLKLYYVRNTYKVTYEYTGTVPVGASSLPAVETYKYGAEVTVAEAANAPGYTFSGWSRSENFTMPAEDVVISGSFTANSDTGYKVEVYYEHEGKYSTVPSKTETLAGTTDTKATVAAETYLPTSGYVFDQNAGNVLEGTIAGDNSLVLKVYYKQVFKVTYAPGDHGSFKSQTYTVSYGSQTPGFSGDKTANGNYRFTGWDKTIESRVTGDIVYTAQWAANSNGGGNGGGGGGNSSGGGGGSSSGPRDNGSTPSGGPGTTTVTIDPDAVPLANLPNEDGADNLLMIDDEDVPLAALPKTGQSGTNGLVFFLSSMMLAAFVAVTKKREDDK
ncbi:doubled motif LPXTG anchor domain-containing protein [Clostridium sp. OM02-18AC]|uniref:doubled motif LPXTG anchor domain-containing protein n=1 Tax=Clostridium sp. OM02-18AC TaxID=2292311 RepID=UPI000E52F1EC|nr:doubled motif LPXTG anchor domain-containing protein [Clostridium sp. OM02-18AC]RHV67507.1 doubled motif LPXTG anchor domain-containing protein [Clostridium sp. OM02-18AC]